MFLISLPAFIVFGLLADAICRMRRLGIAGKYQLDTKQIFYQMLFTFAFCVSDVIPGFYNLPYKITATTVALVMNGIGMFMLTLTLCQIAKIQYEYQCLTVENVLDVTMSI